MFVLCSFVDTKVFLISHREKRTSIVDQLFSEEKEKKVSPPKVVIHEEKSLELHVISTEPEEVCKRYLQLPHVSVLLVITVILLER